MAAAVRLKNIRISIDWSLPLLLIALSWAFGFRYLPQVVYLPTVSAYILAGVMMAGLVVFSIFWHEAGHAIAAHRAGLQVVRIHLYALGGLAELRHRPASPGQESLVAFSGPLFSFAAALFFAMLTFFAPSVQLQAGFRFLLFTNLFIAVFNLIPVYPLDGGRILRGLLWLKMKRYAKASVRTYRISAILLATLSLAALVLLVSGNSQMVFWLGIWLFYLGYMALRAKPDLFRVPAIDELIFRMDPETPVNEIISKVNGQPGRLLQSAIPVFESGYFAGVLDGKDLSAGKTVLKQPGAGRQIDLSNPDTYSEAVAFESNFLPVFDGNRYLGLADAHELRFWLLEERNIRTDEHEKPLAGGH